YFRACAVLSKATSTTSRKRFRSFPRHLRAALKKAKHAVARKRVHPKTVSLQATVPMIRTVPTIRTATRTTPEAVNERRPRHTSLELLGGTVCLAAGSPRASRRRDDELAR